MNLGEMVSSGGLGINSLGSFYNLPGTSSYKAINPNMTFPGGANGLNAPAAQAAPTQSTAAPVDNSAAIQRQNSMNMYNQQLGQIRGSSSEQAGQQARNTYAGSIRDLVYNTGLAQQGINDKAVQNELSRKQGMQGVLGMVGRGIRSTGVALANKNAGDSSAAGALANAYGQLGRNQMSQVGNQYAAANAMIDSSQLQLNKQNAMNARKLEDQKNTIVDTIVNDATSKLAQLDNAIAGASLPNRIQMEQEKSSIRNNALQQLQAYDAELTQGMAGINPSTLEARRTGAQKAMTEGQNLGQDQFYYGTEQPQQTQNTGPFATSNPLFTYRGRDQQQGF